MNVSAIVLNSIVKKLKSEVKDETGYELDLKFNDPVKLKIKDGAARLHLNVDAAVDANLLLKLIEEIKE